MRRQVVRILIFLCTAVALGGAAAPSIEGEPSSKPSGGLSQEAIKRVLDEARPKLVYCYERELQTLHQLAGKVTVDFVIDADGSVSEAKVKTTTLKNEKAEQCMLGIFAGLKYPKPAGGGTVDVSYPMIYKPLDASGCESK